LFYRREREKEREREREGEREREREREFRSVKESVVLVQGVRSRPTPYADDARPPVPRGVHE